MVNFRHYSYLGGLLAPDYTKSIRQVAAIGEDVHAKGEKERVE
jgi:hypothetical protein